MQISGDSTRWGKTQFVVKASFILCTFAYGVVSILFWGCVAEPPPEPTDQEKGESALATKFADEKLYRSHLERSKRTYVLFATETGFIVGEIPNVNRKTSNGDECSMYSGGSIEEIHASEDGVTVIYTQTPYRTKRECGRGDRLLLSEERFNVIKSRYLEEVSTFGQVADYIEEVPVE